MASNMEFVQGYEQHVEFNSQSKNSKGTTLTIVQDFPKKKPSSDFGSNIEMVLGKNT